MTAYIIHLKRATDRLETVERLRTALPGPVHIIDAVDARTLTDRTCYRRITAFPPYPFALRPTEIACFLSHRAAWSAIADGPDDAALVLEDDCVLDGAIFDKALTLAQSSATSDRYIRFPVQNRERPATVLAERDDTVLFKPAHIGLGAQAQLIGRQAASRLLTATNTFDRPIDTTLQMPWMTGQPMLCVFPSGVREISGDIGGSTIGTKVSPLSRLYREVARPMYRLALRGAALGRRS